MIDVGQLVGERYRVDGVLGSGGFADVYLAADLETDSDVALKILRTPDPRARRRFEREGRVLGGLSSPYVTRLVGKGNTADGSPYLVFELAGGDDLSHVLEQRERLDQPEALEILRQLLHALSEAHAAGVLHRDIKPENVRVEYEGDAIRIKLLDFGIARVADDASSLTATGELVGTPRYMSPEQLTGRSIGPASDIYGLGVLAFELLLGRAVMQGNRWQDQLERLQSGYLFPVEGLEAEGARLLDTLRRMTARDPAERFQTANAVLTALDALQNAGAQPTRRVGSAHHDGRARTRVLIVVGAVALLGLIVVITLFGDPPAAPRRIIPTPRAVRSPPAEAEPTVVPVPSDTGFDRCANMPRGFTDVLGERYPAYIPHSAPDRPMPLLVMLHGNAMTGGTWLRSSGFVDLAEVHGFMIVAPDDGPIRAWDSRDRHRRQLQELHQTIVESYCVDEARVFVLGHEQAAPLAYHVACDSWPTAIAINAYSLPDRDFKCDNAPAKPSLLLLPLDYGWMPPDGGTNCKGNPKLSFDEQEAMWRARNGCTGKPRLERLPGAECREWRCKVPFRSCRHGGGGDWAEALPGRVPMLSESCDGGAPEFDRAEYIWRFFAGL